MPNCDNCGCKTDIANIKADNKDNIKPWIEKVEKKVDIMKNWVIAGMATVILQGAIVIAGLVVAWMKLKGGS